MPASAAQHALAIDGIDTECPCALPCRVPEGTVDVVLSYCHNSLHDTSLIKVRATVQTLQHQWHLLGRANAAPDMVCDML
jgi:hypothetical protein